MAEAFAEFEDFYRANFRGTVAIVYGYTGDMSSAQDIAQEAFLRVWQRWQRISRYDDPVAWVRRVSFHLAHSRWRRVKTAAAYLVRQRVEDEPALSPDHVAVVTALRKLPPAQREAIVLHHLMDLPVHEVAEYLEVPVGTVKSWLHRGRGALATELDVDVRGVVVAPPADAIVEGAKRRKRRRATAAALVLLVLGALAAVHLLRPDEERPPVAPSPSPSISLGDQIREVGWPTAVINFGGVVSTCEKPELAAGSQIVFGDLTRDGAPEAVLTMSCQDTHLLVVVERKPDGALHALASLPRPGADHRDTWIEHGLLHVESESGFGVVERWRWDGRALASVDSAPPLFPATIEVRGQSLAFDAQRRAVHDGVEWVFSPFHTTEPHWLLLDRADRPYVVLTLGYRLASSTADFALLLVVLDPVAGGPRIVAEAPIDGPGPVKVLGKVVDPGSKQTGVDLRLPVIEVQSPTGTQVFRWGNGRLLRV